MVNGDGAGNTGVGAGLEFGRAWAAPGVVLSSAVRICGLSLITAKYQGDVFAAGSVPCLTASLYWRREEAACSGGLAWRMLYHAWQ